MKMSDLDEAVRLRERRKLLIILVRAARSSYEVEATLSQMREPVSKFINLQCVREAIIVEANRELETLKQRLTAIGCELDEDEGLAA